MMSKSENFDDQEGGGNRVWKEDGSYQSIKFGIGFDFEEKAVSTFNFIRAEMTPLA